MRLFHLLASHDPQSPTGVPRFSGYFKRAFPEVFNITPGTVAAVEFRDDDVIVTDNGLALLCPDNCRVIIVHHGAAHTHYDRDESWRNATTRALVHDQRAMFNKPNVRFVAPSRWVADRFREIAPAGYAPTIIPHWVPVIERPGFMLEPGGPKPVDRKAAECIAAIMGTRATNPKPVVIGDWRNPNKGSEVIAAIRAACPEYQFRQLAFAADDQAEREEFYRQADCYLCLSLSEGAPYSVADAEAAGLPIVTTPVGNVHEFTEAAVITERERNEQPGVVGRLIARALAVPRGPSFYSTYSLADWRAKWREVILG